MSCICPEDGREIPGLKRVILFEPGAVVREGATVRRDRDRVHIFHADCDLHGYRDVTKEDTNDEEG